MPRLHSTTASDTPTRHICVGRLSDVWIDVPCQAVVIRDDTTSRSALERRWDWSAIAERIRRSAWRTQFLGGLDVAPEDISQVEHAAFQTYTWEITSRSAPRVIAALIAVMLAWWPLDPIVFGGAAQSIAGFAEFRAALVACLVLVGGLAGVTGLLRRHPQEVVAAALVLGLSVSGLMMGRLAQGAGQGLSSSWFQFLYISPYFSIVALVPLWRRVPLVAATAAAPLVGFLVAVPSAWRAEALPASVSFMIFLAMMALGIGHAGYLLTLASFVHRERTAASEAHVRELNDSLEAKVAEQTESLRALARKVESLREEERAWMAREIHDGLGQDLMAIRYALSFARASGSQEPGGPAALRDIERLVNRSNETMRRVITTLRPRILDDLGIGPALHWLADECTRTTGVRTRVELHPEEPPVADELALAVFRVAQEAITNITRHAQAVEAKVSLTVTNTQLVLLISDDGVGLGETSGHDTSSLGMLGIRERALALGGTASWQPNQPRGTLLRLELPVAERLP